MIIAPGLRNFALTTHVAASVGWLGAVTAFLPLAIAARQSPDPQTVRGAFLGMELIGWYALVPLAFASLATGLVQSLITKWGLARHYWVLFKLLITALSTVVLLSYMQTLGFMAGVASETTGTGLVPEVLRSGTAVLHASAALLALLVATTLSVYKPAGMTPYGQRKQREQGSAGLEARRESISKTPGWVKVFGTLALLLVLLLIIRLALGSGHGPGRHTPSPVSPAPLAEHVQQPQPYRGIADYAREHDLASSFWALMDTVA